jgi:hypothetical protein
VAGIYLAALSEIMKVLRSVMLLMLTFTVLVSSTGMTVGMHLCAGEISSLHIFGLWESCTMEQKQETLPPCHHQDEETLPLSDSLADCCEDQTLQVDQIDLLTSSGKNLAANAPEIPFLTIVAHVWSYLFGLQQPALPPVPAYSPPALARNIPVLVQSFLL